MAPVVPARLIAPGSRSTIETEMRNPAASESIASNALTLHRVFDVTASAPGRFADAAATAYSSSAVLTKRADPTARQLRLRPTLTPARPGIDADSTSSSWCGPAAGARAHDLRSRAASDHREHTRTARDRR